MTRVRNFHTPTRSPAANALCYTTRSNSPFRIVATDRTRQNSDIMVYYETRTCFAVARGARLSTPASAGMAATGRLYERVYKPKSNEHRLLAKIRFKEHDHE